MIFYYIDKKVTLICKKNYKVVDMKHFSFVKGTRHQ